MYQNKGLSHDKFVMMAERVKKRLQKYGKCTCMLSTCPATIFMEEDCFSTINISLSLSRGCLYWCMNFCGRLFPDLPISNCPCGVYSYEDIIARLDKAIEDSEKNTNNGT